MTKLLGSFLVLGCLLVMAIPAEAQLFGGLFRRSTGGCADGSCQVAPQIVAAKPAAQPVAKAQACKDGSCQVEAPQLGRGSEERFPRLRGLFPRLRHCGR